MRTSILCAAVTLAVLARPTPAHACGGCFHSPSENPTVVTDHRMILSMSMGQTTLYDQIHYSGAPGSFAWVLPISGTATVGLSADLVFDAFDTLTHTTVSAPPVSCPPPPENCNTLGFAADASAGGDPPVQVLTQEVVGPYETVQLKSSDPQALGNWLTTHGFAIPSDIQPIIDAYVAQGSDFLAMKLVPGATVQSMRPVRVTTQGASPVLPLRMVSAGTGSTVGITLWIVGEGRYEPQNFPFFRIDDSEIVWDWNSQSSNYAQLRQGKEAALNGRGWELESSLALDPMTFTQLVDNGGSYYSYDYDAGNDYSPIAPPDGGDGGETPSQVRDDDLAALFSGLDPNNVRVTRIRSDLAHGALDQDLVLQASADQGLLTSSRIAGSSTGTPPPCPTFGFCSGAEDGGLDDPAAFGGGCRAANTRESGDNLVGLFASVIALTVYGAARKRRKR